MSEQKKKRVFLVDERQQMLTANIAVIFLFLTQIGLAIIILIRRYHLHQTNQQIADLNILLLLSLAGFIALRLILSAGLPALSMKTTFAIYFSFVIGMGVILTLWFGFPAPAEWHRTLLPVLLAPAILISLYQGLYVLGRKLSHRDLEE